jgi:hypothetical protein
VRLPLTEPEVSHSIGLVTQIQEPILPAITALRKAIASLS